MDFAIITCAVWPALEVKRRLRIFLASAEWAMFEIHGRPEFPVIPYGMGDRWSIYRTIKLTSQLKHLKSEIMKPYDTVLYSDGSDAIFTGPISEILEKYQAMGSPDILASASHIFGNVSDESKQYPGVFTSPHKYRFPQVGGWIGKKDAMIAAFERMEGKPDSQKTSDDCFDWYDACRDGWFKLMLDAGCDIFHVTDEDLEVRNGRLFNRYTETNPCVLHLAGGFHDQVHGKDAAIEPWANKLGIL